VLLATLSSALTRGRPRRPLWLGSGNISREATTRSWVRFFREAIRPATLIVAKQSLKKAYESVYKDGFFITQRGTKRPADRDVEKTVDCAEFGKALMAWQCQRPNIAYNEKRLFDEYYKTLFRPDYDPQSILALQTWMNAIDRAWPNLTLNDALKAGKSYVRFHLLYAVSALIAQASGHDDKVAHPAATLPIAQQHATEIISLGVNCLNEALKGAMLSAQVADKVFSPQNWS